MRYLLAEANARKPPFVKAKAGLLAITVGGIPPCDIANAFCIIPDVRIARMLRNFSQADTFGCWSVAVVGAFDDVGVVTVRDGLRTGLIGVAIGVLADTAPYLSGVVALAAGITFLPAESNLVADFSKLDRRYPIIGV